jgi:phage terminase large subunit GpA-like protein
VTASPRFIFSAPAKAPRTVCGCQLVKQFVAEQLVTVKTRRGFARLEWQKLRERNEALDARVYARAAAWIAGLDRWSDERWSEAEREVRVERPPVSTPRRQSAKGPTPSPEGWLSRRQGWLEVRPLR